jgi:hypothetical protein
VWRGRGQRICRLRNSCGKLAISHPKIRGNNRVFGEWDSWHKKKQGREVENWWLFFIQRFRLRIETTESVGNGIIGIKKTEMFSKVVYN